MLNFTLGAELRSCNYCMVGEQVYILVKSSLAVQMHRYINCITDISTVSLICLVYDMHDCISYVTEVFCERCALISTVSVTV